MKMIAETGMQTKLTTELFACPAKTQLPMSTWA
jgi:hypothetical protein